jgi:hypothetical protein
MQHEYDFIFTGYEGLLGIHQGFWVLNVEGSSILLLTNEQESTLRDSMQAVLYHPITKLDFVE